jgi:hypothetical protein
MMVDAAPPVVLELGATDSSTARETTRTPEFSVVEAEIVWGDSQASLLYLVRGLCGVMRARGQKLAVSEQTLDRPVQYRLSFPNTPSIEDAKGPPRMVLSDSDCTRIHRGRVR